MDKDAKAFLIGLGMILGFILSMIIIVSVLSYRNNSLIDKEIAAGVNPWSAKCVHDPVGFCYDIVSKGKHVTSD